MANILTELCESGQNGWTEVTTGGTFDYAYATNPGEGTYSFRIVSAGTNDRIFKAFTGGSPRWAHVKFRWNSLSGTTDLVHFRSSGGVRLIVRTNGSGALTILHGTGSMPITDPVPQNTWVRFWFRYTDDGTYEFEWTDAATTAPTGSGTKYNSDTDGTATSTVDAIYLGTNANETQDLQFDEIYVDDAAYPTIGGSSQVKTVMGLGIASVKTVQGLAIASTKTILGVTNV